MFAKFRYRRSHLKTTSTAVWLFSALCLVAPEDVRAETLEQAMSLSYLNNPTLAAARARLRAVDESVPQALSGWRPTARIIGDAGYRHIDGNSAGILGTQSQSLNPNSVAATVEQPLFRGGRTLAATRRAENTVRAERARLTSVEQTVLSAAVAAYVDVFRDQAVLDLQIRNEQRVARQLEATRDRFAVGEVTRTDVFQAEARLARASADRIGAEGNLERSRAAYRNIVGQMPESLSRPPLPMDLPATLGESLERAADQNPDVVAAEYDERSALDNVDEVRGELLPTVSLTGTVERNEEAARNSSRTENAEALINLSMPLYQSGAVYSRLRQSKQTVIEQRQQSDQARRDAAEAATQAWNNLETARAAIQSFTKEVEANHVALEGVQSEASVGARTVLDVLDAEQELVNAQVSLVRSQRDEVVAAFTLKTAIGELTAQLLDLQVPYYDPLKHYDAVRDKWFGGSSPGGTSSDFPNVATGGD